MLFKKGQDARDWVEQRRTPTDNLQNYIRLIDRYMQLVFGKEITITSYHRPGDKKYHGKMQAADIRTHDMPPHERQALIMLGAAVRQGDSRLQMDPHNELFRTPDEHIHIEFDDNSL